MKKIAAILAVSLGLFASSDCFAKSYGGSRSFSSPKSSSFKSSPSKSYGGAKTSPNKPKETINKASKADVARYQKAVKSGKSFKTRDAAMADFKAKNANKYPSSYKTKPATRPSHIPESYKDPKTGNTYNVTYNQDRGGYGYWSGGGPGLGTFLIYDAMTDMVMMNALMSNQGYHYGAAPVQGTAQAARNTVPIIVSIFVVFVVGALFVMIFIK